MTSACGSVARRSSRLERARSGASTIVTRSRSKKTLHAAEQDRPDVAAARAALKAEQPSLKAPRLVFIDETAVTTKMVRHYGRSPRGERLVASVPHGHWKTLTFIAALRFDGMTAPYVIDGAMDGPTFIAYVEQVLTPTLKKGDVVFMDNLRTHKVDGVRQAIEAVGASVRYLPAYSPERRPRHMLSGMLRCGACGAGMSTNGKDKSGRIRIRCSAATESGACRDAKTFYLTTVEGAVLAGLKAEMRHPSVIAEYVRTYHDERKRLSAKANARRAHLELRLG